MSATWRRLLSAGRRHDRWLLIRLAAQNVGSRRLRVLFLGAAVMLRVGIGFASFIVGWELVTASESASHGWAPTSSSFHPQRL